MTAHVPVGRHPEDRELLFAPLGTLLSADASEKVVCHACGALLKMVLRGHLRRHNLTPASYRERFGLSRREPLLAPTVAQARQREADRRHAPDGALAPHRLERAQVNAAKADARRRARVSELGFASVGEYVRDAYVGRRLTVQQLSSELGCSTRTARVELHRAGVAMRAAGRRSRR